MSASAFRSPLMQQIAAAARSQHRPPLFLNELSKSTSKDRVINSKSTHSRAASNTPSLQSQQSKKSTNGLSKSVLCSMQPTPKFSNIHSLSSVKSSTATDGINLDESDENKPSSSSSLFQRMIETRRTISRYNPIDLAQLPILKDAIQRAVTCATTAPNHHRTEPTTYYRILAHTDSWGQLMDMCYNVALCKNLKKKKSRESAEMNADYKKKKWQNTIGGYIVVCVRNQPIQDDQYPYKSFSKHENEKEFDYWYDTIQLHPPTTEKQLEDYASACASIQNILLSLHSDDWGAKWATGPMIRCRAMRSLVGCEEDEAIAGLIMVGSPKLIPREWRRRRDFSDVLKDLS